MLSTYRRLLGWLRPHAGLFALGLACAVLAALFDTFSLVLLVPFLRSLFGMGEALPGGGRNLAERAVDGAVGDFLQGATHLAALRNVCLVLLAAYALKNLFVYGSRVLAVVVDERVERDLRNGVHAHLQRLPLGFFAGRKAGQLISRVLADTREARDAVGSALSDAVRRVATAAAYLTAMLAISWRLTLLTLALAPVYVFVLRPVFARLREGFRRAYDRQGELVSVLQETVSGIRLVKAYGAEDHEGERFRRESGDYADSLIRTKAVSEAASPISETVSAAIALAVVWVGAALVLGGEGASAAGGAAGTASAGGAAASAAGGMLGPEQFLGFVVIAARLIVPVKSLSRFPARVEESLAAAERFFEILDREPEPPGAGSAAAGAGPVRFRDEIRFEGVSFEYEPGQPVLRELDFAVGKGEVVALVGPSGAGKSTLVDLLPRFIEPTAGRITLDGTDLRRIPLASLRRLMGVVSQEVVIFHDTVRANIAYGEPDRWTNGEVVAAARAARAEEFVRELPEGYDTSLGDRGVRLSGGQRQRIAIARALLRDPPILVLDEATSSVDPEAERLIKEALDRLLEGRTAFVIAHRLSTVRDADRILVMEDGRIVEEGTHEELRRAGGTYHRLHDLQFREAGTAG